MWRGGYYWRATQARVAAMDALGPAFQSVPVTAVMSGAAPNGRHTPPFVNTAQAMVNSYLMDAFRAYGDRWVFSFNVYTYWNPTAEDDDDDWGRSPFALDDDEQSGGGSHCSDTVHSA